MLRMRCFLYCSLLLLIASLPVCAQKGSLEGRVADADNRLPLSGASVNMGSSIAENADQLGRFQLPGIPPGQYELIISHIGYKTAIIPVEIIADHRSSIDVHLPKANLDLSEVRINSNKMSGGGSWGAVDIRLRPVRNAQELLRMVPGLFIAQHAGGGKAEQIFLRGYDIDHGTDIALSVDGLPVNMVSHAHGQGYADLHFLIPETMDKVHFDKGPYTAAKGNLATAAYVDFTSKDFLEDNMLKTELGSFRTQRVAALLKLFTTTTERSKQQAYIASEYMGSKGYFDSPQDFHRFNLFGKYNTWMGNQSQLTLLASVFNSQWNASGQIPDRAVRSGRISRFGAIDDSEGGLTSRTQFSVKFITQNKHHWKSSDQLYFIRYTFNLFSNFTFFMEDPVNGDMINQYEKRNTAGYTRTFSRAGRIGSRRTTTCFGAGFRHDDIQSIGLNKENRRTFFAALQQGAIRETNLFAYWNQDIQWSNHFSVNAALRYDDFIFRYRDQLAGATDFSKRAKAVVSPKLILTYTVNPRLKFYLNNGVGFHSNDSRLILTNPPNGQLARVFGTDLGLIAKPNQYLLLKTALWHLLSEQELLYVGDAGIVEPGGRTRRLGIDASLRYQFNRWLFADLDINWTHARAMGAAKENNAIPLAPSFTSIGGLTVKDASGFSGSLRYRCISDRPATENRSVTAQGFFLLDAVVRYTLKKTELALTAENLLNSNWREAQFDTRSRLKDEPEPVSEIHYTPGSPFWLKASISFCF